MSPAATPYDGRWVGAAVPRKEDRRMLLGRGRFVADLTRPGLLHAAFVRSPHAHARVNAIDDAAARKSPGVQDILTAARLGHPYLLALLERDEFVPTRMPILAGDKVRFVGEPVAVVIADDAYRAEDAAELVEVDWDPRPAVSSIEDATARQAPRLHEEADGNRLVDLAMFDDARLPGIFADAAVTLSATFQSARVAALPLEGRACLAEWDDRDDQLVVHVSTQVPHQVRSGIAQALGLPERAIRVIAPDVGGGFGLKCVVGREEVAVAAAALTLRRPVRWAEDRQENLTAAFHGHEQRYQVKAAFSQDGAILALDAAIDCDAGAYSAFPFTCAVEPLMASTELPGVYKVPAYRARGRAIATNKAPAAPYRGVSRPQIVLVMERLMDKAAEALTLDPLEVRRRNLTVALQRDRRQGDGGGRHDRRAGRRPRRHQRRAVRHRRPVRSHPGPAAGPQRRPEESRQEETGYRMKDMHAISLNVNGRDHELVVEARRTLADMLRHDLGYTGTHLGCEHGICGACTIILDDAPVRACLIFGVQADGAEVRTVEGLAAGEQGEQLSDLQQSFSDHHALQCGFCTPGFLMLAEAYLAEAEGEAAPLSEAQARELVASNLCRCTGYQGLVEAVRATAEARARARAEARERGESA